jgi:hypothetical protein
VGWKIAALALLALYLLERARPGSVSGPLTAAGVVTGAADGGTRIAIGPINFHMPPLHLKPTQPRSGDDQPTWNGQDLTGKPDDPDDPDDPDGSDDPDDGDDDPDDGDGDGEFNIDFDGSGGLNLDNGDFVDADGIPG